MNLKEAFRYLKYLDGLMVQGCGHLRSDRVTKVTKNHMRMDSCPSAMNEEEVVEHNTDIDAEPEQVIKFLETVADERGLVALAIDKLKATGGLYLDVAISSNRDRARLSETLLDMASRKPSERVGRGSGYTFNAEGNQVSYYYDIKIETQLNYDRNKVKERAHALLREADEVSKEIEEFMVGAVVVHTPAFDIHESIGDSIEKFIAIGDSIEKLTASLNY